MSRPVRVYRGVPGPWEMTRTVCLVPVRATRTTARALGVGASVSVVLCGVLLAVFVLAFVALCAVLVLTASVVLAAIDTARERSARHTGQAMMDPTHPHQEEP